MAPEFHGNQCLFLVRPSFSFYRVTVPISFPNGRSRFVFPFRSTSKMVLAGEKTSYACRKNTFVNQKHKKQKKKNANPRVAITDVRSVSAWRVSISLSSETFTTIRCVCARSWLGRRELYFTRSVFFAFSQRVSVRGAGWVHGG